MPAKPYRFAMLETLRCNRRTEAERVLSAARREALAAEAEVARLGAAMAAQKAAETGLHTGGSMTGLALQRIAAFVEAQRRAEEELASELGRALRVLAHARKRLADAQSALAHTRSAQRVLEVDKSRARFAFQRLRETREQSELEDGQQGR
jgi:hypothetical protein